MPNVSNDPEEARIGKDLGSRQFVADDSILNDYFDGLEIDADWYDDHPYDTPVVPSMTLSSVDGGFPGGGFKNAFGNLWMRQQWTMKAPITPGQPYQATSRVVDIYEHRNRTLVNSEVVLLSSGRRRHGRRQSPSELPAHPVLRQGRAARPQGQGRMHGASRYTRRVISSRAIHTRSASRCAVPSFTATPTTTPIGAPPKSSASRKVVVGGRMTMSYVGDLMDRNFGRGWFEGGVLDIKFTNIVWPDDIVTPNVVITDEADRQRHKTRQRLGLDGEGRRDGGDSRHRQRHCVARHHRAVQVNAHPLHSPDPNRQSRRHHPESAAGAWPKWTSSPPKTRA